jgi:hypothetical protein
MTTQFGALSRPHIGGVEVGSDPSSRVLAKTSPNLCLSYTLNSTSNLYLVVVSSDASTAV